MRDVVGGALMVAFFVVLVLTGAALVKPVMLQSKKTGAIPDRGKIALGGALLAIVTMLGAGAVLPPTSPSSASPAVAASAPAAQPVAAAEQASESHVQAPTVEEPKPKLGISLSAWVDHMNVKLKELDLRPLMADTSNAQCDVWCSKIYQSGEHVGYIVSYRGDVIHEVMSVASGDGTVKSGSDILLSALTMATVLSPGAPKAEVSKKMWGMLQDSLSGKKVVPQVIGGIRYDVTRIEGMGMFISATK